MQEQEHVDDDSDPSGETDQFSLEASDGASVLPGRR